MTLNTVLIANRGEIAVRIARAARDAGLRSVAVYADADADAPHVRLADEAYSLGGTSPGESYLDIAKLLDVARRSGADAVHPGYGFLSESAEFARAAIAAGLVWVGPDPETIEVLGDKAGARALAERVGAPLVPGTNTPVRDAAEVEAFADANGLPIVIKAVHGGGGRGMRIVREREQIAEAYAAAVREAVAAFGRGECLVERFLDRPRHLEAQVLADRHGRVAVLGTRDCSLQRRNQKLVEEAPAPFLEPAVRDRVEKAAADICSAAGYVGAGTVEFLLGTDGTLSFLEVNTRLQVEHPVTEAVTGVDIVQEQFRVAAGLPLRVPDVPAIVGHAIEFRINAEDPALGFLPTPGRIERLDLPTGPGVRVDAGYRSGQTVPGSFDSLLGKLVVWGRDREEALARSRRALAEFELDGVATVLPFHRHIVDDPAFTAEGEAGFAVHTRWIEEDCTADFAAAEAVPEPEAKGMLRLNVELDGRRVRLGLPAALLGMLGGGSFPAGSGTEPAEAATAPADDAGTDPNAIVAPFSGTISAWTAEEGSLVSAGETVATIEAMKMETPVKAATDGVLRRLAEAGDAVTRHQAIGRIEAADGP